MTVTDQQARALAFLASATRPHNARRWDEPGILAAITKVAHLPLADVALAVIRAADDNDLHTPGPIANTRSSCWRERANATDRPADPPLRIPPTDRCSVCDQPLDTHQPTDGHQPTRRGHRPLNDHAAAQLQHARQAVTQEPTPQEPADA